MKKLLLAFTIASASLATLNSCTKEYITNNSYLPSITLVYDILANEWRGPQHNKYVDLQVKELDKPIMDQGAVTIALSLNGESTFHTIPATIDGVAYSFEYSIGKIKIKAQDPILDNKIDVKIPSKMIFKITLSDADFVK